MIISCNSMPSFCYKSVLLTTYNHEGLLKKYFCIRRDSSSSFAFTIYIRQCQFYLTSSLYINSTVIARFTEHAWILGLKNYGQQAP